VSGRLISLDEAAGRYDLGKTTLWRWLREGKLKRYRRAGDRRTLVDQDQLDRLVEPREIEP
jgi:excisionase family DNA binding protein